MITLVAAPLAAVTGLASLLSLVSMARDRGGAFDLAFGTLLVCAPACAGLSLLLWAVWT